MRYTALQLSAMAGMTRQTFMKHVQHMQDEGKFEKLIPDAKGFSEADANKLSSLMGFTLKQIENGTERIRTAANPKPNTKRQKNTKRSNRTNDSRRKKSLRKIRRKG